MWDCCECQCESGMVTMLKSGASMTDAVGDDEG